MKYLYPVILILFFQQSFGQIKKAYIINNGKYSADSKNAIGYILIEKLTDSAYMLKEFGMDDAIVMRGTYKDSLLTIQSGKFYYYNKVNTKNKSTIPDSGVYLQKTGYIVDNVPVGHWREYTPSGKIAVEYSYLKGKTNGLYKSYYNDYEGKWSEANVVDGFYEGMYKLYTADSILMEEIVYQHNKIISKKIHLVEAKPFDDFNEYVENRLKKYKPELTNSGLFIKVTVDTTGHLHDLQVIPTVNPEIDSAIMTIIQQGPPFTPSKYDDKPIAQRLVYPLIIFNDVSNRILNKYLEDHMSNKTTVKH